MSKAAPEVTVIIPAYRAEQRIGRAIASALGEPEVVEVFVIDDASPDGTVAAAEAADDGTGRLRVVPCPVNRGPAAARNRGIDLSRAPFIALLDSDDFFLPGRIAGLLGNGPLDWDLCGDNIVFVVDQDLAGFSPDQLPIARDARLTLSFADFVSRNIPRKGRERAELGFMKPLFRRDAFDRFGLRYDENLRLGEDFVLYSTALARGARCDLSMRCGYVAVERAESLSGNHTTSDLRELTGATASLMRELESAGAGLGDLTPLRRYWQSTRAKAEYRKFLDAKRQQGLIRAGAATALRPRRAHDVLTSFFRDRFGPAPVAETGRMLLNIEDFLT